MIEVDMEILGKHIEFPELLVHFTTGDELTLEQKYRLSSYLAACMRTREHHWLQYQNGVLPLLPTYVRQ